VAEVAEHILMYIRNPTRKRKRENGEPIGLSLDEEIKLEKNERSRAQTTIMTSTGKTYNVTLKQLQKHANGSEYVETLLMTLNKKEKNIIKYPGHPLIPSFLVDCENLNESKIRQLINVLQGDREKSFVFAMEVVSINLKCLWDAFCRSFFVDVLKVTFSPNKEFIVDYESCKKKINDYFNVTNRNLHEINDLTRHILSHVVWCKTFHSHKGWVNSVEFSPDGNKIVSGSDDLMVRVWNVESGKQELQLKGHTLGVTSVGFSPDGEYIITGSWDETIRIWSVESGRQMIKLASHNHSVTSVAFSPDGKHFIKRNDDKRSDDNKTVRILNAISGKQELELKGHTDSILSVAYSNSGKFIVSGSFDRTVRMWNASSGKQELEFKGHTKYVTSVRFSPDGKHIVSGSGDGTFRIWNTVSGNQKLVVEEKTNWITSVGFSHDGRHIVSGSWTGIVCIWNIAPCLEM
jgi:hypothetical protein